ncbi:tetratricopeptide repeat protein [Vibrio bathopelagicus]|uniref:tetratricopeptide repeat protein n=1 Tax=Vibrio bathopelagicus TaxID=2777577 RepID=UPI00186515EC|nr:tetratricopeptide repeat protein [Vibrio bathopelagicus]
MSCKQKWSLSGFLDEMKRVHETMPDRRFVFVLGAGASIESKVKGAASLADDWMRIMFNRELTKPNINYEDWLTSDPLNFGDKWNHLNLAAFYPGIFEKCFEGDHEAGYAELEKAIDNRSPSFGYAVLAWVLAQERHNMVITTNFDNLVADSLYIYGSKTPHVIGHESLAGYLKPMARRPMIAKIHRDLFTDPINDANGVGVLHSQWSEALQNIFRFYTPVFIGYGGNDGSLMNFLSQLDPQDINGRPFWCYYENGEEPNGDILKLMDKHQGVLVPTPGFDQLMLEIGSVWGYNRRKQKNSVEEHTRQMLETLDEKAKAIYKESPEEVKSMLRDNNPSEVRDWLDWEFEASEFKSNLDKIAVYEKALKHLPNSPELHTNLANVYFDMGNLETAEKNYIKAAELHPDSIITKGNLAHIKVSRGQIAEAKILFEEIMEEEPSDPVGFSGYASALTEEGDLVNAEAYLRLALEYSEGLGIGIYYNNYAHFLNLCQRYDEAEEMINRAFNFESENYEYQETYAELLLNTGRIKQAEEAVKKALSINPDSLEGHRLSKCIKEAKLKLA